MKQIRGKIHAPVDKVATEKGINLVVNRHTDLIVFTANVADITADVLAEARKASLTGLDAGAEMGDSDTERGSGSLVNSTGDSATDSGASDVTNAGKLEPIRLIRLRLDGDCWGFYAPPWSRSFCINGL